MVIFLTIPDNHISKMVSEQKKGDNDMRFVKILTPEFDDSIPLPPIPNNVESIRSSSSCSTGYDTVNRSSVTGFSEESAPVRPKTNRDFISKLLKFLESNDGKMKPSDNGYNLKMIGGKPFIYKRDVNCEVSDYDDSSTNSVKFLFSQFDVDECKDIIMNKFLDDIIKFQKVPLNLMEQFYNYVVKIIGRCKSKKREHGIKRIVLPPLVDEYPDKEITRKVKVGEDFEEVVTPHKRTLPPMFNDSYPLAYKSVDEDRQSDLPVKVPNMGFVGNIGSVDLDIYNEVYVLLIGKKRTMQTTTFITTMIRNVIRGYDMRLYTPENYKTMITSTTYALMVIDNREMLCMDKLRDKKTLKGIANHNKALLDGISNRRWYHNFPVIKSLISKPLSIPGQRI
jgi:hypothetical protein